MKFLVIASSVFAIISIANAGFEDVSLEPFHVSFWLNTSEKYSVSTSESNLSSDMTEYKISINNLRGEKKANVTIDRSYTPQIQISPSALAHVISMYWNKSYGETNSTLLMIDGHPGYLVTANNSQKKSDAGFGYWLDDRTIVGVKSTYDWNDGSKSLVDTIHIISKSQSPLPPFIPQTLDALRGKMPDPSMELGSVSDKIHSGGPAPSGIVRPISAH